MQPEKQGLPYILNEDDDVEVMSLVAHTVGRLLEHLRQEGFDLGLTVFATTDVVALTTLNNAGPEALEILIDRMIELHGTWENGQINIEALKQVRIN